MPSLKARVEEDLRDAMRARDEVRTSVLRMLKSAVTNREIEQKVQALDDAGMLAAVGSLIKQRRDSAEQFRAAGRAELADTEDAEIRVLQGYLPEQLSAEALAAEVAAILAEAGAKGPKDMGAVMKLGTRLKGRADGKAISDEVRAQLGRL